MYAFVLLNRLPMERNCVAVVVAAPLLPLHNQFKGVIGALIVHITRFGRNPNELIEDLLVFRRGIGRQETGEVVNVVQIDQLVKLFNFVERSKRAVLLNPVGFIGRVVAHKKSGIKTSFCLVPLLPQSNKQQNDYWCPKRNQK